LRYYAIQRNLSGAIEKAALCVLPGGKRHSHQRRLSAACLKKAHSRLQGQEEHIGRSRDFASLHATIEQAIGPIKGIGDLAVYDIAHRIGSFLKLEPELVYLHAGTLDGARTLGLDGIEQTLAVTALPDEFHVLRPYEAEDCLCIYKRRIRDIMRQRGEMSR
jgi:hypothetical protein